MTFINWLPLLLSVVSVVLLGLVLKKLASPGDDTVAKLLREEFKASREESAHTARELREEVAAAQKTSNETVIQTIGEMRKAQKDSLESVELRIKELVD